MDGITDVIARHVVARQSHAVLGQDCFTNARNDGKKIPELHCPEPVEGSKGRRGAAISLLIKPNRHRKGLGMMNVFAKTSYRRGHFDGTDSSLVKIVVTTGPNHLKMI